MKLATYKWNIAYSDNLKPIFYYGYKTKKEAQETCDIHNKKLIEKRIVVIKYDNNLRKWVEI